MRKFLIPLTAAMISFTPAMAQEDQQVMTPEDAAFETLLNQYATITLGLRIDERCNQLHPKAADLFATNQKVIDDFMASFLPVDAYEQLTTGISEAGKDEVANPCGPYTFDFIQAGAQIASTMAYRIQILNGEEEPEPEMTVPNATPQPAVQPEPKPVEVKPEPTPVEVKPKPAPVEVKPEPTPVEVKPEPKPAEVKPKPTTISKPAGETKKEMNNRQREEILNLRRQQKEEVAYYKANIDDYPDPKATKKAMEDRHDADMKEMRQRQFEEDQAQKNK